MKQADRPRRPHAGRPPAALHAHAARLLQAGCALPACLRPSLVGVFTLLFAVLPSGEALAHGRLLAPPARTADDYQFGAPCGDFPEAGPIRAQYTAGQEIDVEVEITLTHGEGDSFHFQLCDVADHPSDGCFQAGELASFRNDGSGGIHQFRVPLPEVACTHCVLRWEWDYGFRSCADVEIKPAPEPGTTGAALASLLALCTLRRRGPCGSRSR